MDEGKRRYSSYFEAEHACGLLKKRMHKSFSVYGKSGSWYVGGVHMKKRATTAKRKSLDEIKLLFQEDIKHGATTSADVGSYAAGIDAESSAGKLTFESDKESLCVLSEVHLKLGTDLSMKNSKTYLVLDVDINGTHQQILMGGAFEPHIPLVMKQAQRLKGKPISWHTWNAAGAPEKWGHDSWFYMIEERLA